MKTSEFLNEGLFQSLASINVSSEKNKPIDRNKVLNNIKSKYLSDFKEDFLVDFKNAIEAKNIDVNMKTNSGYSVDNNVQSNVPTYQDNQGNPLKEDDYEYLNFMLESALNEAKVMSISQWVFKWFSAYMKGTDWNSEKTQVMRIAKKMENERGNFSSIKDDLARLAEISWNVVKDVENDNVPYGANDVFSNFKKHKSNLTPDEILQAELGLSAAEKKELRQKRELQKNNT